MVKNIIMLILALAVLAAIIFGVNYAGKKVDNKSKYQHPITKPGASW